VLLDVRVESRLLICALATRQSGCKGAGVLPVGVHALAATLAPAAPSASVAHVSTMVKPPVIKRVRFTCHPRRAIVSLRLRNLNTTEPAFQVRLSEGDEQQAQAVTLPGKTAERVRLDDLPDGE
jgi:hypothetical protein